MTAKQVNQTVSLLTRMDEHLGKRKAFDGDLQGFRSSLTGTGLSTCDVESSFKRFRRDLFDLYPDIERKLLHRKIDFQYKGMSDQSRALDLSLKVACEDKETFHALLVQLNETIVSLDESSNYAVIEHIHEVLFDLGRNIERKLKLFRQMSSRRELQRIFK